VWLTLVVAVLAAGGGALWALTTDFALVGTLHEARAEHADQYELLALVKGGDGEEAFAEAFEHGDELFETEFNALDGVGANVGDGTRFTRVPRADLGEPGQWAAHVPERATGPNAMSCNACHIQLFDDGSGSPVGNVHRDPLHSGNLRKFIQRNTPHTFALGALQRLAEEMTTQLYKARDVVRDQACLSGASVGDLTAKGVSFGSIRATRTGTFPCTVAFDTASVEGVSSDLIVRPFQWKGIKATIRDFNRDAAHNELGMQAVEIAGDGVDGDGDGIADELSVGDITALTVYLAAQPRPTTKMELASLGLIDSIPDDEVARITAGAGVFRGVGCASCHVPRLFIGNPIFSEPSRSRFYREDTFPAGQDSATSGVDPAYPITFDLTFDQPDNQIKDADGNVVFRLGSFEKDDQGRAIVELYSDLKRHRMGAKLAESIDEVGTGAGTFLTRTLWGVGSTAPYLHDGRATTLTEAILEHGGEAGPSRAAFLAIGSTKQQALIAFLDNLVLFKMSEDEVVVPPPPTVALSPRLTMRAPRR
jgi:hypothetical protein